MNLEEQKAQFLRVADAMDALAVAIEPLFKAGSKVIAPGTDWWATVAGNRHKNLVAAEMYRQMAIHLDDERPESTDKLQMQIKALRLATLERAEKEGPCTAGCMLTWANLYGK